MFVSMGNQLRYSVAVLLGRRLPTESLDRIVRDLVATLDEFGNRATTPRHCSTMPPASTPRSARD